MVNEEAQAPSDDLEVTMAAVKDLLAARARMEEVEQEVAQAKARLDEAREEVRRIEDSVRDLLDLPGNEDR